MRNGFMVRYWASKLPKKVAEAVVSGAFKAPTTDEVTAARVVSGLNQLDAVNLCGSASERTWRRWESTGPSGLTMPALQFAIFLHRAGIEREGLQDKASETVAQTNRRKDAYKLAHAASRLPSFYVLQRSSAAAAKVFRTAYREAWIAEYLAHGDRKKAKRIAGSAAGDAARGLIEKAEAAREAQYAAEQAQIREQGAAALASLDAAERNQLMRGEPLRSTLPPGAPRPPLPPGFGTADESELGDGSELNEFVAARLARKGKV